ncbi:MAG: methyltransferase domain-containing protein [Bacteroidetes bacterium]|nr:methyltransferase domain-containing protein [Bacteroidota bacterium]
MQEELFYIEQPPTTEDKSNSDLMRLLGRTPEVLDITMGHRGMQKEVKQKFGIGYPIISLDIREEMTNGMKPDIVADSRALPFDAESFDIILFDPPFSFHKSTSLGNQEYRRFYVTYGLNLYTSRIELGNYIQETFREVERVLRPDGYCLLKWSESRIKLDYPLSLKGGLQESNRWQRPSKHWGTKTGTATWYIWLTKGVSP